MKYKIAYNGGKTLILTEKQYLINKEYWDKQLANIKTTYQFTDIASEIIFKNKKVIPILEVLKCYLRDTTPDLFNVFHSTDMLNIKLISKEKYQEIAFDVKNGKDIETDYHFIIQKDLCIRWFTKINYVMRSFPLHINLKAIDVLRKYINFEN
jgi:hypothetical protein